MRFYQLKNSEKNPNNLKNKKVNGGLDANVMMCMRGEVQHARGGDTLFALYIWFSWILRSAEVAASAILFPACIHIVTRVGPDLVCIVGYPAGLSGMPCRISGLFLADNRISCRIIRHCQICVPTLIVTYIHFPY